MVQDRVFDDDNLFKTLVMDNEIKLMKAHNKYAKKKGIL
jgi:hypothetical protein